MALSITKVVPELLSNNPEKRFTAREIAKWIFENYRQDCEEKRARSTAKKIPLDTDDALIQQLVAEIGSQRRSITRNSKIRATEGRPRRYYYSELSEDDEVDPGNLPTKATSESKHIREHDLYPLLSNYLRDELDVFSVRIDEKRATNRRGQNGNRWLFPDLVGLEDLSATWDRETKDCVREFGDTRAKLWSFEVKLHLNSTNVREAYFQTVSNSSWANLGYLVAAEIEGRLTMQELRTLSGVHGIGVMELNPSSPSDSQILIPARERQSVDWLSADRLVQENSDFLQYIKVVRHFHQTGDLRKSDWDYNNR
ncbi:COG2958 family protein [Ruegeria arenilitoris]|uniref:COG2958 family protein n=1 Tax=Ruegeria arenilitoris TaxID=1173585 RepID=UPI00147D4724|nr:HrgA protein [Ruegeria arenilitoris]